MKHLLVCALILFGGSTTAVAEKSQAIVDTIINNSSYFPVYPLALINWKVGERAEYKIAAGFLSGSMVKFVEREEVLPSGAAIWVKTNLDFAGRREVIETLIDRATAEVKRLIRNGQEQEPPSGEDLEVISQDYQTITVPAGTFESIHIVANTKDIKNLEIWINPSATVMEGTLKSVLPTQFMKVVIELTKFTKVE